MILPFSMKVAAVERIHAFLVINQHFQLAAIVFLGVRQDRLIGVGTAIFHEHEPQMKLDAGLGLPERRPSVVIQVQRQCAGIDDLQRNGPFATHLEIRRFVDLCDQLEKDDLEELRRHFAQPSAELGKADGIQPFGFLQFLRKDAVADGAQTFCFVKLCVQE